MQDPPRPSWVTDGVVNVDPVTSLSPRPMDRWEVIDTWEL